MQIVFFNIKTQNQYTVDLADDACESMEDMRILIKGDVYRPVSTVPDEVNKLNKLRIAFENAEFEQLKDKFNIQSKDDIPENFVEKFSDSIDGLISEKYPEFAATIGDKKAVYSTLSNHFLSYVFMIKRFTDLQEENKSSICDPCYALDYAMRFKKLFSASNWESQKSIKEFSEELDKTKKFMDFDERRHAGYDKLLSGIGSMSVELSTLLSGDVMKDVQNGNFNNKDPKYKPIMDRLYKVFASVHKYYDTYIEEIRHTVAEIAKINDDKLTGYLRVAKVIVTKFIANTDNYLKECGKAKEKANLDVLKKEYISQLREYYDSLNTLYSAYDADVRDVDKEREKLFLAIWESSIYYKDSKEGDWFIQLAKLMIDSYIDAFGEIMTEEEKTKFKNEAK